MRKNDKRYSSNLLPDSYDFEDYRPLMLAEDIDRYFQDQTLPWIAVPDPYNPGMERYYPNPYALPLDRIGSFKEYLMANYQSDYLHFIRDVIQEGALPIGKKSYLVPEPEDIFVRYSQIERINLYRRSSDSVYVDVIISTEISVCQMISDIPRSDTLKQWYRLRLIADLGNGYDCGFHLDFAVIYDRNEPQPGMPLDEYLIPYNTPATLEADSAELLRTYYAEALAMPCQVVGEILASRMGLEVRYYRLTQDSSIRGQMYFSEREIAVYNQDGQIITVTIPANTIVVDLNSCFDAEGHLNREQVNSTIIHECYHAFRHRLFFLGQLLYNEELRCLSCSVAGIESGTEVDRWFQDPLVKYGVKEKSPIDWIEWQANRASPRIQMPAQTARIKIDTLRSQYENRFPKMNDLKRLGYVIRDLAIFYGVSKQTAKLRMLELGYDEVQGVMNFANGAYVEAHTFTNGALARNQTVTIDVAAALDLYCKDEAFRKTIQSGSYQYVDGHFCRSDRKYIYRYQNKLRLTNYAKTHMDECCLIFTVRGTSGNYFYQEGTLQKEDGKTGHAFFYSPPLNGTDYLKESKRLSSILYDLPGSPSGTLKAHMKRKHFTIDGLVAKTGVSIATIKRLRTEPDYRPSKEIAMAICIGLQLEPMLRRDWMDKLGIKLSASPADIMLELMMDSMYMQPLSVVNQHLATCGFPPLSNGVEELSN